MSITNPISRSVTLTPARIKLQVTSHVIIIVQFIYKCAVYVAVHFYHIQYIKTHH